MNLFGETIDRLSKAAAEDPRAVVGFSGGKDSLVCLDLACRTFPKVSAYFMYFVPGLACCEAALDAARKRWGVEIVQDPVRVLHKMLSNGVHCFERDYGDIPEWRMPDVYAMARHDTNSRWVVHGAKESDSVWRRRTLANFKQADVLHPLKKWSKYDVLGYLHAHKIPVPDTSKGNATGIDLKSSSLLWLHEQHPADFKKLCEVFPFAEAVVWREKWYGPST